MTYLLFTAAWLICGYCAAGYWYAFNQLEFPSIAERDRGADICVALVWGLLGPISLTINIIYVGARHGRLYPWQQGGEK